MSEILFPRLRAVAVCSSILLFSAFAGAEENTNDPAPAGEESAEVPSVSEAELATARLHFGNGVDLISESTPNYQDAYQQFLLAFEKSGGSWKVLGNLGLCALKLERDGEALDYYAEYLEKGGDEVDPEERKYIEKEILIIQGSLTTVEIESSDPSARITVQRQGSSAPAQIYELTDGKRQLRLRSGQLTIHARAGGKVLTWQPVLSSGDERAYRFDFADPPPVIEAGASSEPGEDKSSSSAPAEKTSGMRIFGYVTAGVGVLALGGGAITGAMSQSKAKKAEDLCINGTCQESTEGDFDSAKGLATVANILFISGGVLAATGVTLVILGGQSSGERPQEASLRLTPGVAPGGGALFASGSF